MWLTHKCGYHTHNSSYNSARQSGPPSPDVVWTLWPPVEASLAACPAAARPGLSGKRQLDHRSGLQLVSNMIQSHFVFQSCLGWVVHHPSFSELIRPLWNHPMFLDPPPNRFVCPSSGCVCIWMTLGCCTSDEMELSLEVGNPDDRTMLGRCVDS
jgi:hypothetical protein